MSVNIESTLRQIEIDNGLEVLFAVESGSRMWGFASPNSDYDVRFVYRRRPKHYLAVTPKDDPDLVFAEGDIDAVGWDIRKFLRLVGGSNPAAFEWLTAEIPYRRHAEFYDQLGAMWQFLNPFKLGHHYLSMARHNYREHMRDGTAPSVRLKKYLYITRPLLCLHWLHENNRSGLTPPMDFGKLLWGVRAVCPRAELEALADAKRAGDELAEGPAHPAINDFIDETFRKGPEMIAKLSEPNPDFKVLDRVFQDLIA